jgi:hypothetical protein
MLYKITRYNKYGSIIERIVHSDTPLTQLKTMGILHITPFKYKHTHEIYPPLLFVDSKGDKYLTPSWQKVLPETTLDDIEWSPKVKKESNTWTFKSSSSPDVIYTVRLKDDKLICNCSGYWRSKGNCKHVKEVKASLAS